MAKLDGVAVLKGNCPTATALELSGLHGGKPRAWTILAWYASRPDVPVGQSLGSVAPAHITIRTVMGRGQSTPAHTRQIPVVGTAIKVFGEDVRIELGASELESAATPAHVHVAAIPGHMPEQYVSMQVDGTTSVRIPDFATGWASDPHDSTTALDVTDPAGANLLAQINPRQLVAIPELAHAINGDTSSDAASIVVRCFG